MLGNSITGVKMNLFKKSKKNVASAGVSVRVLHFHCYVKNAIGETGGVIMSSEVTLTGTAALVSVCLRKSHLYTSSAS